MRRIAVGPIRPASRELTTLALVRWRSAYVPHGKAESARALPSRIRCGLHDRRKRSQELSGINCVTATIQLTGREPATLDCSVDRRFGDACGPWLYFGHIGGLTVRMAKILVALDGKDGVQ